MRLPGPPLTRSPALSAAASARRSLTPTPSLRHYQHYLRGFDGVCSYATGQKVCRPLCPPVPSYFTEEIGGGVAYVSMDDAIAEATPPPPAPCATAETSYEAVLLNAMAQYVT